MQNKCYYKKNNNESKGFYHLIRINHISSVRILKRYISLLLCVLFVPVGMAYNIHLSPRIDLGDSFETDVFWQPPQVNLKNNQQYYIANSDGQFHLIDDNQLVKLPILDIQQYYPEFVTFNRSVLHPNFALSQQKGYNTFYTAHVEPADKAIRTLRVKDKSLTQNFPYEVVIVEWQLNEANSLKVNPDSKREILRIGINNPENGIIAMRFNPYIKSWHDNFSHLYIALAYDETLKNSALYSGAVLRINPEKFGLRSYTTPNNNPFINQSETPDELLITGIQKIMQFVWQKNNDQQLIVSHVYNKKMLLSQVDYGDALQTSAPKQIMFTSDTPLAQESLILYRGREFKALRNKLLFMSKPEGLWQLQSIATSAPFQKSVIHAFSSNVLASNDQFSLFTDNNDELMLFSRAQHVIQQLDKKATKELITGEKSSTSEPVSANNDDDSGLSYIFWFVIIIGGALAWLAKNKKSQQAVKSLLHKNYARFELSIDNKQLALFHRHQQTPALTLDVSSITRSDVLLNDEHLLSIEADISGFDEQQEQLLESKFIDEKRIKMVDHRTRKIDLNITDKDGVVYGICLYFREGNQRLTKAKFGKITDEIKEWCWFISKQMSPEKTGKRIVKIVQPQPQQIVAKPKNKANPEVAADALDTEPASEKSSKPIAVEKPETAQNVNTSENPKVNLNKAISSINSSDMDTQLIEALDKLANLKAQGYLTDDEFIRAKTKILADLQKE